MFASVRGFAAVLALGAALVVVPAVAQAQAPTFRVISVNTTGCDSGDFGMTVERANLDGGSYTVNTRVTVGGLVYMNEAASISINGLSGWNVFNNFTYGAVPNPGTYPIPSGQTMTLDFSLERPIGASLYRWRLVVDGCDTGNILFNGPIGNPAPVPGLAPAGVALLSLALVGLAAWRRRFSVARARP